MFICETLHVSDNKKFPLRKTHRIQNISAPCCHTNAFFAWTLNPITGYHVKLAWVYMKKEIQLGKSGFSNHLLWLRETRFLFYMACKKSKCQNNKKKTDCSLVTVTAHILRNPKHIFKIQVLFSFILSSYTWPTLSIMSEPRTETAAAMFTHCSRLLCRQC